MFVLHFSVHVAKVTHIKIGMLELANRIEVVDGNRTWIDQKAFDGFVNDDLKPIARLDGVKEVSLNWNSIDDVGLKYLSGLSSLKRLALDGCPVSDNGLKQVTNLKNIEHLSLAYTKVTDNGIIDLTKLQKSKYLSLEGTNVSSECLIHLGNLKNLETLKLSSTKICQANIDKIAQLNELEELYIADTAVSDLGQVLKDLPNLRWLVVDGTNLGDELIVALQSTSLDRLSVDRTNLSRKSFDLILRLELRNSFSGYESGSTLEQLDVIGDDIVSGRAITGQ